jgi:hypothetical protein
MDNEVRKDEATGGDALASLIALSQRPLPPELPEQVRPFVGRAKLTFRNFRQELERVQSAILKAKDSGELPAVNAIMAWSDHGNVVSVPLIGRYCEARAFEPVDAWLRARDSFRRTEWPNAAARAAIEGYVAHGRGDLAASLCLAHIERLMKRLRQDWKERRRKPPRKLDTATRAAVASVQSAIVGRIPAFNVEVLVDIGTVDPVIAAYGNDAQRGALAAIRVAIVADQAEHSS